MWTGRGRPESDATDDVEDYRVRQPSEPALWDFLSTKFPTVKGWLYFTLKPQRKVPVKALTRNST